MLRRAGELYCRGARGAPRQDAYAESVGGWELEADGFEYGVDGLHVVLSCRAERAARERHNCPNHIRVASERHSRSRFRRKCSRR